MTRIITVGAAQVGPIRGDSHANVVKRRLDLLRQGGRAQVQPRRKSYKATTFNFARHRQPAQYRLIVERTGAEDPA